MKIEEIKALVAILESSSLNYLEISEGEFHLKLGKDAPVAVSAERTVSPAEIPAAHVKSEAVVTGGTAVKSPMVGVFYAAPSPEAEPFVTVGQAVKKGQVLCIIEAMKLMNEIVAEKDGVIVQICAENGDIVEFGQPLLYIQ